MTSSVSFIPLILNKKENSTFGKAMTNWSYSCFCKHRNRHKQRAYGYSNILAIIHTSTSVAKIAIQRLLQISKKWKYK